jgi:hypothetical protein
VRNLYKLPKKISISFKFLTKEDLIKYHLLIRRASNSLRIKSYTELSELNKQLVKIAKKIFLKIIKTF